jgi:O-antigen/teichoic acid export membrane protein
MPTDFIRNTRFLKYMKLLGSNYGLLVVNIATYAISVPLLMSWLGPAKYGVWLILLQLLHMVSFVVTSIAVPIAREAVSCCVEGDKRRLRTLLHTVSSYYLAVGAATVLLAILLAAVAPNPRGSGFILDLDTQIAVILLSVHLITLTQLNLLLAILTGFQLAHITNLFFGALTVMSAGLGIIAAGFGLGLAGLAVAQFVAGVVVYVFCCRKILRRGLAPFGFGQFDVRRLLELLRPGTAYLGYGVSQLLLQSDIILVGFVLGPATAAAYGIAYKVLDYFTLLIWRISDSLFPVIAELDAVGDINALKRMHRLSGRASMALVAPAATALGLYGHAGMSWWIGSQGAAPLSVFGLFSCVLMLQVLVRSSLVIPFATNRMGKVTTVTLAAGCLKVIVSMFFLFHIGVGGAAIATILVHLGLTSWYVPLVACRITKDRLGFYLWWATAPVIRPACFGALVGAVTMALFDEAWLQIAIGAPLGLGVYAFVYLREDLNRQHIQWLWTKLQGAGSGGIELAR